MRLFIVIFCLKKFMDACKSEVATSQELKESHDHFLQGWLALKCVLEDVTQ